jgi:hypothetical protein
MGKNDLQSGRAVAGLLDAIPYCMKLFDRDGLPCQVWRNPRSAGFSTALKTGSHRVAGLRALLTANDLYVWQSVSLLHGGFAEQTGIDGVRVGLRVNVVMMHEETVAFPEHFLWVYPDTGVAQALDVDDRREIAAQWLRQSSGLRHLYPNGFDTMWYC